VDANNNGARDSGESGIAGVLIQAERLGGGFIQQLSTDANGNVTFIGLPAGQYKLSQSQNTVPSPYLDGIDTIGNGGGTVVNNVFEFINVGGPTTFVTGYTFGEVPPATITGTVFDDLDNDGIQDSGEAGIPNVPVDFGLLASHPTAVNFASNNQATTTGSNGVFTFNDVAPGPGLIRENPANLPVPIPGFRDGIDRSAISVAATNDRLENFTIPVGATLSNVVTFGEVRVASLSGRVFVDSDLDGQDDSGEAGVAGISVRLDQLFGSNDPTQVNHYNVELTTNGNGEFTFDDVPAGQYILRQSDANLPSSLGDSVDIAGSNGGVNNSANQFEPLSIGPADAATGYGFAKLLLNTAPESDNDSYTLAEDGTLSADDADGSAGASNNDGVLANDSDEQNDALSATLLDDADHGQLALNADGTFTYTPAADYFGPDSFTYRANDGTVDGNVATVSINVTEVNDAPAATNDTLADAAEDTASIVIPFATLLGNDSTGPANESGQTLAITSVGSAVGGTVEIAGSDVIFTPAADYNGPASFSYTLQDNGTTDGAADHKTATTNGSFTITEVNDTPTGNDDGLSSVAEDSGARTISFASLLGNDSKGPANESGQALTITSVGSAVGGAVAIAGTDVIFTPTADYNGAASFSYTLQDNGTTDGAADPRSATATASFTITPANDAPVAAHNSYTTAEDTPLTIAAPGVLGNDGDIDSASLTATLVSGPGVGVLVFNSDGSFAYTPIDDFTGTVSFTYRASDGDLSSNLATVTINITPSQSGGTIIPDPCGDGDALLVHGTSGDDVIHVSGNGSSATVTLNGASLGTFSVDRIIIRAEEGNDNVHVDGSVGISTWLFGETGNDTLNAGNASSIVMGGAGHDHMNGGSGRDLMIGGSGADRVVGNPGDDILVAAFTDHDKNYDALCHIMEEWTRTDAGFGTRVDHLNGSISGGSNAGFFLNSGTCHDDVSADDVDKLTGSSGNDWFIYDLAGGDRATGVSALEADEAITNI
jgi:VCBS repeat-containing protein